MGSCLATMTHQVWWKAAWPSHQEVPLGLWNACYQAWWTWAHSVSSGSLRVTLFLQWEGFYCHSSYPEVYGLGRYGKTDRQQRLRQRTCWGPQPYLCTLLPFLLCGVSEGAHFPWTFSSEHRTHGNPFLLIFKISFQVQFHLCRLTYGKHSCILPRWRVHVSPAFPFSFFCPLLFPWPIIVLSHAGFLPSVPSFYRESWRTLMLSERRLEGVPLVLFYNSAFENIYVYI